MAFFGVFTKASKLVTARERKKFLEKKSDADNSLAENLPGARIMGLVWKLWVAKSGSGEVTFEWKA
jgi:hypothetical protein